MLNAEAGEAPIAAEEVYFLSDDGSAATSQGRLLPPGSLTGGWHSVELWGAWASRRDARIRLRTPLPSGAGVMVALLAHAPPGGEDPRCVVEIGGAESEPKALTRQSQWIFAEGVVSRAGIVGITLRAVGTYGKPDARDLYVGLRGLAFCAAHDPQARRRLVRKLRGGVARRAIRAAFSAVRAFRNRRAAPPPASGSAAPSGAEAREAPSIRGDFPVLDRPLSERALPERLSANGADDRRWLGSLDRATHRPAAEHELRWEPHASFLRIGWLELDNQGRDEPLLVGVVAVRARIVSERALVKVELRLHDQLVATVKPALVKQHASNRWLYVVNAWLDCDRLSPCRATLTLTAIDKRGEALAVSRPVNVTRTPPSFEAGDSDAFVPSPNYAYDDLSAEILQRPAVVRPAARSLFSGEVRRILVMRVDQLGDLSATLPAMRRLREAFPEAELTALVAPALVDIVRASGLFAQVVHLSLAYSHESEKRYLDEQEQARFRKATQDYSFDVAIDLCPAPETRPLLKLIDATYLLGFHPDEFPFLDFGVKPISRDKINQEAALSHASMIMTLVEAIVLAAKPVLPAVKRQTDDSVVLSGLGVEINDYVTIHSGARHKINCWPEKNFLELADRIAGELGRKVVFFSDSEIRRSAVEQLKAKDLIRFPGKLPVDQFDALLSNSRLMIGNDSGPKHLAAVRGVDTVSIHINRLNWREWGQSSQGVIISKPVPCCGCELNNEALCGKDVACVTSIKVDEVFDVVRGRLERDLAAASDGRNVFDG